MMKSAWGSDDPTKAAFPFLHGLALSEAGHAVQIFLLGEAVTLMRKSVAAAVVPVGWPPLEETLKRSSGDTSRSTHAVLAAAPLCHPNRTRSLGSELGSPAIFVSLVEWADRVITE